MIQKSEEQGKEKQNLELKFMKRQKEDSKMNKRMYNVGIKKRNEGKKK